MYAEIKTSLIMQALCTYDQILGHFKFNQYLRA